MQSPWDVLHSAARADAKLKPVPLPPTAIILNRLPDPDAFGNYWLSGDHTQGPAIFPRKFKIETRDKDEPQIVGDGTYSVWLGPDRGFLTDSRLFRIFYPSPDVALRELRRAI